MDLDVVLAENIGNVWIFSDGEVSFDFFAFLALTWCMGDSKTGRIVVVVQKLRVAVKSRK